MPKRTIRQRVWLPASPLDVYEALATSKGHAAFTGASARISPRVGGRFEAWGGYIHGTNLELVPGERIVQSWRPSEPTWPDGHDSKVTFRLRASRGGTRLDFTHEDVPADHIGHLSEGWKESYWGPLKVYFTPPTAGRAARRPVPRARK
jgi:uncharacterized protein YndB with AHSA1/START domain